MTDQVTAINRYRCRSEVYDGWEDTSRCLLDRGHKDRHNYTSPASGVQRMRWNFDLKRCSQCGQTPCEPGCPFGDDY